MRREANGEMARMAGLEPATAALTVRCPTIGRHPNLYRQHQLVAGVGFEPTFFRLWACRWYHSSQSRSFT